METISKTRSIDPLVRMELLKGYMNRFIDEWPYKRTFEDYIWKYHAELIPDTKEYYRANATHCYYCNGKLTRDESGKHPLRSSEDHWVPKSRGQTERYVICCADCNSKKGDAMPLHLASRMLKAALTGRTFWGVSGEKLQFIANRVQIITNDILYNTGPKIYYTIKKGNKRK